VLSGGELAAAVVVDAVARLKEGVLGNETSVVDESFGEEGLPDWPQHIRPAEFRGWKAPEVLLGETTRRSGSGGEMPRVRKPGACAPTC
jgi:tRNA (guanine37-N1)-methyltransferase